MNETETAANLSTEAAISNHTHTGTETTVYSMDTNEGSIHTHTAETVEEIEKPKEEEPKTEPQTESKEEPKTEETNSEKVPESYEDFSLPDGMKYNSEAANQFKEVAKELGLTQSAAQKLVDYQTGITKAAQEAHEKQVETWKAESEKSIGKDGIEQANRAIAKLASPEFVEYLNDTGLGNHPAMVAVFKNVYEKIGESSFVDNNSYGQVSLRNDYSKLYPSMKDFYK